MSLGVSLISVSKEMVDNKWLPQGSDCELQYNSPGGRILPTSSLYVERCYPGPTPKTANKPGSFRVCPGPPSMQHNIASYTCSVSLPPLCVLWFSEPRDSQASCFGAMAVAACSQFFHVNLDCS